MKTTVQFFGVAGYKIITPDDIHIVIDPFLDKNPYSPVKAADLKKVDVLLITHNAFDHFGDSPQIINQYKPIVICALDVIHNLTNYYDVDADLLRPTIWGMEMSVLDLSIRPVESHHWSFAKKDDGQLLSGPAMGFVIDTNDGNRFYHPGDTALFADLKTIGKYCKPNIAFMHVSLPMEEGVGLPHPENYKTGEVTPQEALDACEWLGIEKVIASHYVDPECEDVKEFVRLVEENKNAGKYAPETVILAPGESCDC